MTAFDANQNPPASAAWKAILVALAVAALGCAGGCAAKAKPTVTQPAAAAATQPAAAAADKIKSDSADTRAALRKVTNTGNDLLKSDRAAVLVALSGTDATVLAGAQAKLATDRTQVATATSPPPRRRCVPAPPTAGPP